MMASHSDIPSNNNTLFHEFEDITKVHNESLNQIIRYQADIIRHLKTFRPIIPISKRNVFSSSNSVSSQDGEYRK